jgi:4'-phosphopantetheinyl transferase EntD
MPIFYQQDIDEDTKLGIWKIEEDENFFLQSVVPQRNVSHPHKKLQHLAGRYLLKYLFPDFPLSLIQIADTRKPYLENEAYHFSISHCGDYAAAIVSKIKRVGVDIEIATEKVERIRYKFLSGEEMTIGNGHWGLDIDELLIGKEQATIENTQKGNDAIIPLTIFWSCKEAVFKWYGLGEVDFKQHIVIEGIKKTNNVFETAIVFRKKGDRILFLRSRFFENNLCLSYVVT